MRNISEEVARATQFYGEHFTPCECVSTEGTSSALDALDIFLWCDDIYIVDSAHEHNGVVRCADGSMASNDWRWDYQGVKAFKLGTISKKGFLEILNQNNELSVAS
ncbi:hypothetical protein LMH73_008245 [Vibrio splendidus]|nr:hypothetical protein [Vibrio splendidus]MCC4880529.1 hypothetical protein [Vibrio splendidus]